MCKLILVLKNVYFLKFYFTASVCGKFTLKWPKFLVIGLVIEKRYLDSYITNPFNNKIRYLIKI